jgi:DivIVA domain-containing protein
MRDALSPEELEGATFSVALRGYDRDEVDAFLKSLGDQLRESNRMRSERLYETLGEEMGGLLQHARDSADEMIAEAKADATRMREEARQEAEQVRAQARADAEEARRLADTDAADTRSKADADAEARIEEATRRVAELEGTEAEGRNRIAALRMQLLALTDQLAGLVGSEEQLPSDDEAPVTVEQSAGENDETIRLEPDVESTPAER